LVTSLLLASRKIEAQYCSLNYTAVNGMNEFLKFSVKCFIKSCCGLVFVIQKSLLLLYFTELRLLVNLMYIM